MAQLKPRIKQHEIFVVASDRLYLQPTRATFNAHNLVKVVVQGIPEVTRAVIAKDESQTKFHLLIEGGNLLRIMGTQGVDGKLTKSNHVIEMEKTLGIEAARSTVCGRVYRRGQQKGEAGGGGTTERVRVCGCWAHARLLCCAWPLSCGLSHTHTRRSSVS